MKILLAVDGSECSMAAVDETARIPWPKDSALKIISVAEMPLQVLAGPMPMPSHYFTEWEKALEDQAVANTTKALSRYYESGGVDIKVTTKATKGDPREAILDEASHWDTDLIIIGTHGYNAFERLWLGSVSRTVASHAKCSILVARCPIDQKDRKEAAIKILLAVDGSEGANFAVREVAERPWLPGSEAHIISAVQMPFFPTPEIWALPDKYYTQVEQAGRDHARDAIERAIAQLKESDSDRETPLILTSDVVFGRPEEVIISTAKEWGAELIVLGSHGHSGWQRLLLGSVSQAVASHASCSVQIVRSHEQRK